jgi:hypothetical protein
VQREDSVARLGRADCRLNPFYTSTSSFGRVDRISVGIRAGATRQALEALKKTCACQNYQCCAAAIALEQVVHVRHNR